MREILIKMLDNEGEVYSKEGGLFMGDELKMNAREEQIKFLHSIIKEIKPKNVIEIGTHRGYFGAFLMDEFKIKRFVTFGLDPKSNSNVNLLKKTFPKVDIKFIHGDSRQTFSAFESEDQFDMIWVDGGHKQDMIESDLKNCARLGIEHVLVDDIRSGFPEIPFAIKDFCEQFQYVVVSSSYYKHDWKGIAYLRKRVCA